MAPFLSLSRLTVVLIGALRHNTNQIEEILRLVAQQVLQVAHKAVDIALARRLVYDVLVVVVAEAPGQLLVVHLGLVLADTPPSGNLQQSINQWVFIEKDE